MAHRSGIWVRGADPLIRATLIEPSHLTLLLAAFGVPIMTSLLVPQERFLLFVRKGSWQGDGLLLGFEGSELRLGCLPLILLLEQFLQVFVDGFARLDRKPCGQGIERSIGIHSGRIDIQFFPPDQFGLLTLFKNAIEKAAKQVETITGSDPAQA